MLRPLRSLSEAMPGCAQISLHPGWSPPSATTFGLLSTELKNDCGNALPMCAFPAVIAVVVATSVNWMSVKPSSRR